MLQKLRGYQAGGEISDRQWRDVISVLRSQQRGFDTAYLSTVATGRMAELLARAVAETE